MEEKIFIIVHDWVIQRLKSSEAMCYELIRSLCKDGSKYSGGAKYIAQRLGMTENAVSCILAKLRAMNVLEHEYITNGRGRYSAYWPNDENLAKALPKNLDTPTQETCIPITKKLVYPSPKNLGTPTQETWDNNKYNNKYNKENNKDYSSPSTRVREEKEFDEKYFVEKFNEVLASIQNVHPVRCRRLEGLSQERKEQVEYLSEKYGDEYFWNVIIKAFQSQFLNQKESSFTYDLDWIINESRFLMIAEDKYKELHDNKPNNNDRTNNGLAGETPQTNADRAAEWATNRIKEVLENAKRKNQGGVQGEIPDGRSGNGGFLPF